MKAGGIGNLLKPTKMILRCLQKRKRGRESSARRTKEEAVIFHDNIPYLSLCASVCGSLGIVSIRSRNSHEYGGLAYIPSGAKKRINAVSSGLEVGNECKADKSRCTENAG